MDAPRSTTDDRRANDTTRRSTKPVAARAGLNEFAEKVSKGALSLGVAGAVLAQVRVRHRSVMGEIRAIRLGRLGRGRARGDATWRRG